LPFVLWCVKILQGGLLTLTFAFVFSSMCKTL
jgi:hypothetical protein